MQSAAPVHVSVTRPETALFLQSWPARAFAVVSATAFVAGCAHVSLPLPFTPVPLTLSDFAVLVVGLVLGPVLGFFALVLYLAEGALGLPVFNPIGLGGVAQLMGPTAGYLFAYPFAAATAGIATLWMKKGTSAFTAASTTGAAASTLILASGAAWIAHLRLLSPAAAWTVAVAPFLFGAGAKIVAASGVYAWTRRWIRP